MKKTKSGVLISIETNQEHLIFEGGTEPFKKYV